MGRRENRNEVVLSCLDSVLSCVGPMDEGVTCWKGIGGCWLRNREVSSEKVSLSKTMKVIGCSKEAKNCKTSWVVPNLPMMRDYENILVAIVGRDRKAFGEVGGRPLVPLDRERFGRTCGDRRSKADRDARDTRGRRRCGGDTAGESLRRVEAIPRLRVFR